jgi:hypothetical protein
MKNLLILAILTVNVLNINAQRRQCDIKTLIPYYNVNDTFYSPDTVDFKFFIVNQGPDSIKKGDLFGVNAKLTNVYFEYTFPRIAKDLGVGDTGILNTRMVMNFTKTLFDIDFCMYAELGIMENGGYFVNESDQQKRDNTFCTKVNHISRIPSTNLKNLSNDNTVVSYPNPFRDFIIIPNISLEDFLSFKDFLGKQYHVNIEMESNQLKLNTSNLSAGIYLLTINYKNEIRHIKIVKN